MLWGIEWNIVQRMLIDAPHYDYDKENDEKGGKTMSTFEIDPEDIAGIEEKERYTVSEIKQYMNKLKK